MEKEISRLRFIADQIAEMPFPYPIAKATFRPGLSVNQIECLELPPSISRDYLEFISQCSEIIAMDVHSGYHLMSPENCINMTQDESIPLIINGKKLLPIGANGGGAIFLLESGPSEKVWKCRPYEDPESICETFSEFINRIIEDWEHFLDNDNEWDYLAQ